MPVHLPPLPSARDFNIYFEVDVQQTSQLEVARTHALSRGRVSQIVNQIRRFVMTFGPGPVIPPALRLLLAQNTYQLLASEEFASVLGAPNTLDLDYEQGFARLEMAGTAG